MNGKILLNVKNRETIKSPAMANSLTLLSLPTSDYTIKGWMVHESRDGTSICLFLENNLL